MGRVTTVGNSKGGVGKSTISVQIAIERARAGRKVLLINGDRQETSELAILQRSMAGVQPGISCVGYKEGDALRAQVIQQRDLYDDVIIDVGGRDSSALRAALFQTDMLIIPFEPGSFEVWALKDMSLLIADARTHRGVNFPALAFLNKAEPKKTSADNREAAEALKDYPEMEWITTTLVARKIFRTSSGMGLSVNEMKVKEKKATEELKRLISRVFQD